MVPGCEHRFLSARLLGLHLRMGHSDFDREKVKSAETRADITLTPDGLAIQTSTCVEGHIRWAVSSLGCVMSGLRWLVSNVNGT